MASSFKSPILQAIDQNGNPVPGAKLFVFASGTTTPVVIYSNQSLTTPLPNPLIANARGYFASAGGIVQNIWWDDEPLRLRLTDPDDNVVWEIDDYRPIDLSPQGDQQVARIIAEGDEQNDRIIAQGVNQAAIVAGAASAEFYPDIAAGLAGTTDGEYFIVADDSSGDLVLTLYLNDDGSELELGLVSPPASLTAPGGGVLIRSDSDPRFRAATLAPAAGGGIVITNGDGAAPGDIEWALESANVAIGVNTTPVTGTALTLGRTYVFNSPLAADTLIKSVAAWAMAAGDIYLRRFTLETGTFTQVGAARKVTLSSGSNTVSLSEPFIARQGEYVGFYQSKATVAFNNGTGNPTPYFQHTNAPQPVFASGSAVTATRIELSFAGEAGPVPVLDDSVSDITADRLALDSYIVGQSDVSDTYTSTAGQRTYALEGPMQADGYLRTFSANVTTPGTLFIRRFTRAGDDFTRVGPDYPVQLTQTGVNVVTGAALGLIPFLDGEYVGWYGNTAVLVAGGDPPRTPHYRSATTGGGNFTTFTSASTTSAAIGIGFDIDISEGGEATRRVEILEANVAELQAADPAPQIIGQGDVSGSYTSTSGNFVFAFKAPALADSVLTELRINVVAAGQLVLKRMTLSGSTLTQVGPDYPVSMPTTGAISITGANLGFIPLLEGEHIAYYVLSGSVAAGGSQPNTPYFRGPTSGNVSTFEDTNGSDSVAIGLGVSVSASRLDNLGVRVTALEQGGVDGGAETDLFAETITGLTFTASALNIGATATYWRDGATAIASGSFTLATPTTSHIRYDVLHFDTVSGALGITQGTERTVDPALFQPTVNAERLPVGLIRVAGSSFTVLPAWRGTDGVDRRIADALALDRERSRRLLPKWRQRLAKGDSLRIVGFGDSITAIQNAAPSASVPNGVQRDRLAYFSTNGQYPSDVTDAIPLFTSVELGRADDGAGAVHTKIGWNWELVEALQARGYTLGTDLFYDNFGIGGNSSADAVTGSPFTATTWLSSAVGLNADLAVIALGMNERGDADSQARLTFIAEQFQAAGTEVLFIDCPRPRTGGATNWLYTCRAIRRAALATNSAHLSIPAFYADEYLHSASVFSGDLCEANGTNHPGIGELEKIGAELARVLA